MCFSTSFRRPLVNDGESMLRILFHSSSSTTVMASLKAPFRPKSYAHTQTHAESHTEDALFALCSSIGIETIILEMSPTMYFLLTRLLVKLE